MPQSAAASDIDISSEDGGNTVDAGLLETIGGMDGVKRVYGRRSSFDISVGLKGNTELSHQADMVSFDDFDLKSLKKDGMLKKGSDLSKVYGDSRYVLATWDQDCGWEIGDTVLIGDEELDRDREVSAP